MQIVTRERIFGGEQQVIEHESACCQCTMRFGLFLPPERSGPLPVLTFLSGLTCTEQNFVTKAGAQRLAAELGIAIVAPDTSPRGEGVPDAPDQAYDLGLGASFYLDATEAPWNRHYRMESYIADELQQTLAGISGLDLSRQAIMGHSMGGHGALTLHLKYPSLFQSVSAFAPIVAPSQVPWGQKAFTAYLGSDKASWRMHDACELVRAQPSTATLLVDQGGADEFKDSELRPELLASACRVSGQPLTVNFRDGYSHSYYFIASFIDRHLAHHAAQLGIIDKDDL